MCGPCLIYHMHEKYSQHPRGAPLHTVTQRPRPTGSLPFPARHFQACGGVSIQPADAGKEEARIPMGQSVSQPWTCRASHPHAFRGQNSTHGLTRLQGRLGNIWGREPGGKGDGSARPPASLPRCLRNEWLSMWKGWPPRHQQPHVALLHPSKRI